MMTIAIHRGRIQKVAFLGSHLPRQCGIATFTADLAQSVAHARPDIECLVVAMNDPGITHFYPECVRFEIVEDEIASYRRAAQFLNAQGVDVVSVQHEYGIFGGKSGSHVLTFLRELRMPAVVTLHTVLGSPSPTQRAVLEEVIALSARVVIMSDHGSATLQSTHAVSADLADVIPHGIPIAAPGSRGKTALGFADQPVILTFGLLSPDKGLEYVVDALPQILEHHPRAVFVVVGATHPHVKERHGESYRLSLISRARRLGVESSIVFHDRFVSDRELADFLAAADVYVTPYLNPEQSTSGTLARAVAAGRAVVSTPYWHARELLADGRGVLVPVRDSQALGSALSDLLADDGARQILGRKAAEHASHMAWPVVAEQYVASFEHALERQRKQRSFGRSSPVAPSADLPEIDLSHLRALTDETGLLQHAMFNVPRYEEGYCLDDNARALLLTTLMEDAGASGSKVTRTLADKYLAFVAYAFNSKTHRFRNFMSYSRHWLEEVGSEDSHGNALWALGTLIGRSGDPGRQGLAGELFQKALPVVTDFSSPRAWALSLLGIHEYLRAFAGDSAVQGTRKTLVTRLLERFESSSEQNWVWFEKSVTYCNSRLPQALILSGVAMGSERIASIGLRSLEWLSQVQTSADGCFAPIGTNGFYPSGGTKAAFDQQPVEAGGMVSACLDALRASSDVVWAERAGRAFDWFLGQNQLRVPLYDATSGGCHDGLHPDRLNQNQGAESTLAFLLALVEMRAADTDVTRALAPHSPALDPRLS